MKFLTFLLFLRCAIALPTTTLDPIPSITLSNPTFSSGACPNASVNTLVTTINSTTGVYQMKYTLDAFTPWVEIDRVDQDQQRDCFVKADVGIPPGWRAQANKARSDISGYLNLVDDQTTAHFRGSYSFDSNPDSVSSSTLYFVGPMNGRFTRHMDPGGKPALSSCDGDTLQTEYRIRADGGSSTPTGYIGPDPEPEELKWVITSWVELLRC